LQLGESDIVLQGVGQFYIADGVRNLLHLGRYVGATGSPDVPRPVNGGAEADLGGPIGAYLRKIVSKDVGRG